MIDMTSTYRLQFHKDFTFRNLERCIPYLNKLGVRTIYASPIFEAVPGSQHGYDIVNPLRLNPEIGTEAELGAIAAKLKKYDMHWLQDIVPNHMAFHPHNLWLMDVLEKGRYSVYATFFDLGWTSDLFHGRSIVPVLADTLENILFRKELQITHHQQRLSFEYQQLHYPLHPRSYRTLFEQADAPEAVQQFTRQISDLHQIDQPVTYALRWHELMLQLDALLQVEATRAFMTACIAEVNMSGMRLQQLLDEQTYKLTPWQLTDRRITFRRFFTVNELIGLNMQDEKVFQHYHEYIFQLVSKGMIQGLRIDHVDGLYDPQQYLERLRALAGDIPIVVEKILKRDENLPTWRVQGATGYEFLADVNQLMTYAPAKEKLDDFYKSFLESAPDLEAELHAKKTHMLHHHMEGELDNLYHLFLELNLADKHELTTVPPENVKACIAEFLIQCPVYRYYGNRFPLPQEEALRVRDMFKNVLRHQPELKTAARLVEEALLGKWLDGNDAGAARAGQFYLRCMQFTGPLMAKGMEDTLMYTYNRFLGHNEVGDGPENFGLTVQAFHTRMIARQRQWPLALNATSTHDTKRGEDVRARFNAFSELPDEWVALVRAWRSSLPPQKEMPDENDVYFILQTLAGVWRPTDHKSAASRMEEYLVKAFREAKRHTDWATPNEKYEAAAITLATNVLKENAASFQILEALYKRFDDAGLLNALVQLVLKFMCPGIPDVYQGSESWNFSLVDPDNRRPVDYAQREKDLDDMLGRDETDRLRVLWESREDARIKVWLTHVLCGIRAEHAEVFSKGDYVPLEVRGTLKDHAMAFARHHKTQWLVIVIPRFALHLATAQETNLMALDWKDTHVVLPAQLPPTFTQLFAQEKGAHTGEVLVSDIFKKFPLAVLEFHAQTSSRGAGVLMHITSLPGSYFVGDLGGEAYRFVDFLLAAKQSYWQVLPLNPTMASHGHSPYSAYSSMGGNPMLISPDVLVEVGLLTDADLKPLRTSTPSLNFEKAAALKEKILDKAWQNFQEGAGNVAEALTAFSQRESYWLDDFALFSVLRNVYPTAWTEWPEPYKNRRPDALLQFSEANANAIAYVRWQQFLIDAQWQHLKAYSNDRGIRLVGDMPFYVIHDSADVWSNQKLFSLTDNGAIVGMAGVPPDYFSNEGQLWGMPVYRWEEMEKDGYAWWKQRIRKNRERYDLLRLDHFRAFAQYWEVPAKEKNAVRGAWHTGPGNLFFESMQSEFGRLDFIAEDLGEITPDVFELRDAFGLPGMKVLHFAFGEDLPRSLYAPHNHEKNFIVYTGTHDNNTTVGWFEQDLTPADRERLSRYAGREVSSKNVHEVLLQFAYGSVANVAIAPLQDLLGLDGSARMNTPGTGENNWKWMLKTLPSSSIAKQMRDMALLYNR